MITASSIYYRDSHAGTGRCAESKYSRTYERILHIGMNIALYAQIWHMCANIANMREYRIYAPICRYAHQCASEKSGLWPMAILNLQAPGIKCRLDRFLDDQSWILPALKTFSYFPSEKSNPVAAMMKSLRNFPKWCRLPFSCFVNLIKFFLRLYPSHITSLPLIRYVHQFSSSWWRTLLRMSHQKKVRKRYHVMLICDVRLIR